MRNAAHLKIPKHRVDAWSQQGCIYVRIAAALIILLGLALLPGTLAGPAQATGPPTPYQSQSQRVSIEVVGQIGGPSYAVDVVGHYAYLGVGPRLVSLDVSNPASHWCQTALLRRSDAEEREMELGDT